MEDLKNVQVGEDVRQSEEYGKYMERIGWKNFRIQGTGFRVQVFVRRLGPVGIAKIQRSDFPLDWEELGRILKKERVIMVKVEPNFQFSIFNFQLILKSQNFKQDNWPLLGTKTLRISLSPSLSKIFSGFKKDARYILRKIQDTRYKIQRNNFDNFYEIWKTSAKRKSLWIPSKKDYLALVECFGKKCFGVTIDGQAGAVILIHDRTAYYYYAGATKEANELNLPYLVVWEAMKEAKKRGCNFWDFEGIYDRRWPNKGWVGFSHFKKSFGGVEVESPGCFTKWSLKNVFCPFKHHDDQKLGRGEEKHA